MAPETRKMLQELLLEWVILIPFVLLLGAYLGPESWIRIMPW